MKKQIKFSIQELLGVALTMVVLGIGVAYGLDVLVDVRGDFSSGSQEYMAVSNTTIALGNFTEKLGTLATIVVASTIIGVLVTYMYARFVR